jgi:hypothetical protein
MGTFSQPQRSVPPSRPQLTLDALAAQSSDELAALYRTAVVPATMRAADGALVGRMLAAPIAPAVFAKVLRRIAAAPAFVWEGKTFQASSDLRGVGHNRVNTGGLLGRQHLFPFETAFAPSSIDGKPALILDYALDVNPAYIRKIHDEIREVTPGLFFGPAMWKTARGKRLVVWFGLDSRLS